MSSKKPEAAPVVEAAQKNIFQRTRTFVSDHLKDMAFAICFIIAGYIGIMGINSFTEDQEILWQNQQRIRGSVSVNRANIKENRKRIAENTMRIKDVSLWSILF